MPTVSRASSVSVYGEVVAGLHGFAGVLLVVFSFSHLFVLTVQDSQLYLASLVFPFTTNWTVYVLAATLEFTVAVICLKNKGSDGAYCALLVFVVLMVWYRWALSFTSGSGTRCHCLGVLGSVLHLSQRQEESIPIAVLLVFSLITGPWFFIRLIGWLRRGRIPIKSIACAAALAWFTPLSYNAYGQWTIQVTGQYEFYHCNSATGEVDPGQTVKATFAFTLSGNAWSICATNVAANHGKPVLTPWECLIHDGTDTFTLTPGVTDLRGKYYPIRATIYRGPFFLRDYDEDLDLEILYLTYGLRPTAILLNTNAIVEIPLPWFASRSKPLAYGAQWNIIPSQDGMFMSECQVVANTNLDLRQTLEALRPTFTYPCNLETWNRFVEVLGYRRILYPHGFVQSTYKCLQWFHTNHFLVPVASEESRHQSEYRSEYPFARGRVTGASVALRTGFERLLPNSAPAETLVSDYRYRTNDGRRLLPFLEYVIPAGGEWRSSADPLLARKAQIALMSGIRYDFAYSKRRSYFTWLLCALLVVPVLVILRKIKIDQK
jgi:hypothetical protein